MNYRTLLLALSLFLPSVSCQDESKTVEITSTRRLTDYDHLVEGFDFIAPKEWRRLPRTDLRRLNFKFGENGEVYFSQVKGELLENANRWLKQFGKEPEIMIDSFPLAEIAGGKGYLVEAEGDFKTEINFGGRVVTTARSDWGLIGVIALAENDSIVTVKMIGPAAAVKEQKENFLEFCKNMKGK